MNEPLSVVLLGASPERRQLVVAALDGVASVKFGASPLAAAGALIVLVDLGGQDLESSLHLLEDVGVSEPAAALVALGTNKDAGLILRAMRAGAREFAVPEAAGELAAIVSALAGQKKAREPRGTIVSIFPAKGGTGATTIATNLAGALVEENRRVILVDVDAQFGDVLVFLDMASTYSIAEVVKNLHRLDRDLLLSSLTRHASGVSVLAQADSLGDVPAIEALQITVVLQFLARHFDFVICDGIRGFDDLSVAVLDASDKIELLLTQDVPSLKNAKHLLEVFDRLGYDPKKIDLVVNRFHKDASIDLHAVAENLGAEPRATLANDYASAMDAMNRGVLLGQVAPRSKLTADIARLAALLSGITPPVRVGFLRSLFGNGGSHAEPQRAPETA